MKSFILFSVFHAQPKIGNFGVWHHDCKWMCIYFRSGKLQHDQPFLIVELVSFRTWTRQDEFTAWTWSEPSWGKGIPVLALEPLSDCHPKLGIYISSVTAKRQCPLCDQAGESIQHLLISCGFARQVWFIILQRLGLSSISPVSTSKFLSWWHRAIEDVPKEMKKGLIHLWPGKFVSTRMSVFNGANPSITILLQTIRNECILWCSAGAKGFQELLVGSLVVDWFFLSFCCCSLSLCLY